MSTVPAIHCIHHHIKTTGSPVFARFRRLAPDSLAASKQKFTKMEEMSLCQKGPQSMVVTLTHHPEEKWLLASVWELQPFEHADRTRSLPSPKHPESALLLVQHKGFLHTRPPEDEPFLHQRTVLDSLHQNVLVVPYDKCTYGANEVAFLGHHFTYKGVRPLPEKVAPVQCFLMPSPVKALKEFLGMINY
ncbi:uncharacterized protein [Palaemon carinicauda]|uniref:uncharacterized protein n=1 Tax=Palaemon carinicauda TaxID=392227 RepID=UPI0035B5F623